MRMIDSDGTVSPPLKGVPPVAAVGQGGLLDVVHEERLLTELNQRIRDVRTGPDGLLYVLTDSPQERCCPSVRPISVA